MSETVILERPHSTESAKNDTRLCWRPAPRKRSRQHQIKCEERRHTHVLAACDPSERTRRPAPRRGVAVCKEKSACVTGRLETAHAPSGRLPGGESDGASKRVKHEADGFRGVGLRNFGLGTGPLRDRPRTGFRSGHLRKRDIPHTVSLMPCGLGRSPCPHRARDASGSGCPTRASRDASHATLAGWVRGLWGRRRRRG